MSGKKVLQIWPYVSQDLDKKKAQKNVCVNRNPESILKKKKIWKVFFASVSKHSENFSRNRQLSKKKRNKKNIGLSRGHLFL